MTKASVSGPKGLTEQVAIGTGWSSLSTVARQLLSLACVGILARLLGPGAYGLIAMANILTVFLLNFRDLGTAAAVIQRPVLSPRLLSSLFWLNCGIGVVLSLIVAGAARPMAYFFHEPKLVQLLEALSVSFIITSAGVVHNALLTRTMAFKKLALADIVSGLAGYAVAIPSAFAGLGVWSLVLANITSSAVSTAFYWGLGGWLPRLEFDSSEVRSIGAFSLNLSGFGLVNYFSRNADNLIVGKFLGKEPLGFYQMAYNLMLYPIQNVSSVIGQVLLPAFSRIQDDNDRFRQAYIKSCMLTGLISLPVMTGMGVIASPMIHALLGPKWSQAVPVFQILAPVGLAQSIQGTVGHIYIAKGRTNWMFRWSLVYTAVVVTSFLVGVPHGIIGVAVAYCAAYFAFAFYPGFAIPFRLIDLRFSEFARNLWPQTAITVIMGAVCLLWLALLNTTGVSNAWIQLISTVLLGAVVYILLMLKLRPAVIVYMEETLLQANAVALIRPLRALGMFPR